MTQGSNRAAWTNYAGNVSSRPQKIVYPTSEAEVAETVVRAAAQGLTVRVVGAGHSYTPVCATDGVLINLDRMGGLVSTDPGRRRVVARAGARIRDLGDPLWEAGLCLKNQGDIDAQAIAGAMATATHGSGLRQQSFSGTARGFRIVQASGETLVVTEDDAALLAAAQTSLGMLGVVTEVEIEARTAFALREQLGYWTLDEVLDRWDEEMSARRHFSFFWMPTAESPKILSWETPEGMDMTDRAIVKLYDELSTDVLPTGRKEPSSHVDRPYRIYPDPDFEGEIKIRELEYMIPFAQAKAAFLALRTLMLERWPEHAIPVEVRAIAADSAYLSPFYQRDSVSLSTSGHADLDFDAYLMDVTRVLAPFSPRPHWGKMHYFDKQMLNSALPRYAEFCAIRERLDPSGVFLNDHLRALFT